MLSTIAITVLFFAIAITLMAIGVVFAGRRLAGSCGGDPNSVNCRCSPEKRKACADRAGDDEDEELLRPGEERLMQLRRRADPDLD
jgi:hypothetical protein